MDTHKAREIKEIVEKTILRSGYTVDRVILFGSRARGEHTSHSDWDLLVVINEPISWETKKKLWLSIRKALAQKLKYEAFDILIRSKASYEKSKKTVGSIANIAEKEGITL